MKLVAVILLIAGSYAAEKSVRSKPILGSSKNVEKVNASAVLKASAKTGSKMVQDAYVALDQPGMTPPQEMAMFSAQFPNGNVCGEDKNPKHGSCAHSCMNNCRKSFATCNKMYKNCLKTGKWELLKKKSKAKVGDSCIEDEDSCGTLCCSDAGSCVTCDSDGGAETATETEATKEAVLIEAADRVGGKKAGGEQCDDNDDCNDGRCEDGECTVDVQPSEEPTTATASLKKAAGEECDDNDECNDGRCENGQCTVDVQTEAPSEAPTTAPVTLKKLAEECEDCDVDDCCPDGTTCTDGECKDDGGGDNGEDEVLKKKKAGAPTMCEPGETCGEEGGADDGSDGARSADGGKSLKKAKGYDDDNKGYGEKTDNGPITQDPDASPEQAGGGEQVGGVSSQSQGGSGGAGDGGGL